MKRNGMKAICRQRNSHWRVHWYPKCAQEVQEDRQEVQAGTREGRREAQAGTREGRREVQAGTREGRQEAQGCRLRLQAMACRT